MNDYLCQGLTKLKIDIPVDCKWYLIKFTCLCNPSGIFSGICCDTTLWRQTCSIHWKMILLGYILMCVTILLNSSVFSQINTSASAFNFVLQFVKCHLNA